MVMALILASYTYALDIQSLLETNPIVLALKMKSDASRQMYEFTYQRGIDSYSAFNGNVGYNYHKISEVATALDMLIMTNCTKNGVEPNPECADQLYDRLNLHSNIYIDVTEVEFLTDLALRVASASFPATKMLQHAKDFTDASVNYSREYSNEFYATLIAKISLSLDETKTLLPILQTKQVYGASIDMKQLALKAEMLSEEIERNAFIQNYKKDVQNEIKDDHE
jgi:hypothetical protein